MVSKNGPGCTAQSRSFEGAQQADRSSDGFPPQWTSTLADRDRQRTSTPLRRGAPEPCRYCCVAFSRRMCCSRVCRVRRKRRTSLRVARNADQPSGHPALCAHRASRGRRRVGRRSRGTRRIAGMSPTTMSASVFTRRLDQGQSRGDRQPQSARAPSRMHDVE